MRHARLLESTLRLYEIVKERSKRGSARPRRVVMPRLMMTYMRCTSLLEPRCPNRVHRECTDCGNDISEERRARQQRGCEDEASRKLATG